jgi:hypothetical protein
MNASLAEWRKISFDRSLYIYIYMYACARVCLRDCVRMYIYVVSCNLPRIYESPRSVEVVYAIAAAARVASDKGFQ